MTLNELRGYYDSYEKNLAKEFYIPLFGSATVVDRVSCYFSSKALALYATGLEEFAHRPGTRYRLIISEDIDKDDFDAIQRGERNLEESDYFLVERLREDLTLAEKTSLEILVELISVGTVEIKIALVNDRLFHYKWAYVEGPDNERMMMLGSNNETEAAIRKNYESFDFRPYYENDNFKENFEIMWQDKKPGMIIKSPSELIWKELRKFSKNKYKVLDEKIKTNDCLFLDLVDGRLELDNRLEASPSNYSIVFKSRIERYVSDFSTRILFKKDLDYVDFKRIIESLSNMCYKSELMLIVSKRLNEYIDSHDLILNKRISLGLEIKRHDGIIVPNFEKYKAVVDENTVRQLYDQQMWDSFFMYSMMKAGNFSVPGSGKTASVLGVLAYLKSKEEILNMVVVCPLNSFESWISEYRTIFGKEPQVFDSRLHMGQSSISAFFNEYASSDMILINYQSINKYGNALKQYLISKCLLVFDEAHYVKNWETKRSEAARFVAEESTRTIVLTGTPMPNSYTDMYSLLHILFPKEYDSYFRYNVATLRKPSPDVIEDMSSKMQPFYCRTSKKKLGVPPENPDESISVTTSEKENELYRRVFEACRENPLTMIIRLLQAESDPSMLVRDEIPEDMYDLFGDEFDDGDVGKTRKLMPTLKGLEGIAGSVDVTSKTLKCVEIAKKLVSENKTVIIWCIFKKSIDNLNRMLNEQGVRSKSIDGSVPPIDRGKILDEFKNGEFEVLITNPHTLAESVSLHTVCHDTIYYEYSYNLVHMLQSKDRIHRLGLKEGQYTQHRFLKVIYGGSMVIGEGYSNSLDGEIYARLKVKEKTMNDAIEANRLEASTYSSKEDIREIFEKMGWEES